MRARQLLLVGVVTSLVPLLGGTAYASSAVDPYLVAPQSVREQSAQRAALTTDGMVAFFTTDVNGRYHLKMLSRVGGSVHEVSMRFRFPLTSACCASPDLVWSPSGNRLAVQTQGDHNAIWTINPDGSRPRRVTPANGSLFADLVWAPSGRSVLYVSTGRRAQTGLYRAPADGQGKRVKLANGFIPKASWSPNGHFITYIDFVQSTGVNRVMVMKPDGTGKTAVWKDRNDGCIAQLQPVFSASSHWIVFGSTKLRSGYCKPSLSKIRPDGTDLSTVLGPVSGVQYQDPMPAPSGDRIVVRRIKARGQDSVLTTLSGSRPQHISYSAVFAWSQSGRWLELLKGRSLYQIVHPDGSNLRTLFAKRRHAYRAAWQPR